jgi:hypothetical protein
VRYRHCRLSGIGYVSSSQKAARCREVAAPRFTATRFKHNVTVPGAILALARWHFSCSCAR